MLTQEAKAILQLLVNHIRAGRFRPSDERTFMGYREVHLELNLQCKGPRWGGSLRMQGLDDLVNWLQQKHPRLPAISGLIVDQTEFRPGEGYFNFYGRPLNDRDWWMEQVRQSIAFDWSPYVEDDPTPSARELWEYTQAVVEGRIVNLTTQVRSRCEALRNRARQYYRGADGTLRCEVCDWSKPLDPRIVGDIVELHHIRPLAGIPSDGTKLTLQEAIRSLAPLCPCCHRIAHARREERTFKIEELKTIVPKYPVT